MAYMFTISPEHLTNSRKLLGRNYYKLINCMGRLLPGDIGKRVYSVGDIWQVENDEQRNARMQRAKPGDVCR